MSLLRSWSKFNFAPAIKISLLKELGVPYGTDSRLNLSRHFMPGLRRAQSSRYPIWSVRDKAKDFREAGDNALSPICRNIFRASARNVSMIGFEWSLRRANSILVKIGHFINSRQTTPGVLMV